MTTHNSIQNTPNTGANLSATNSQNDLKHENISCSEVSLKSNNLLQEIRSLIILMDGYSDIIHNTLLNHSNLEHLTLPIEAIETDIARRLNYIFLGLCPS